MDEGDALLRLLRPYSPTGREAGAVREFVRLARELGYSARIDAAGNGLARVGTGRPRVLFLGHIDTVPGRRPVRRSRGRVFGRGAVDAKGPLVAALLAGSGFAGPGTLEVIAAVGEETDSRGARHLLARRGVDAVIAGEPSRWDGVTVGYKGDLRVDVSFRGRRTHYSSPQPTTTDLALGWAGAVRAWVASHRTDSPFRSLSMKVLRSESLGDGDAESVRLTVDLRLPPGATTTSALKELPREPGRPRVTVTIRIEPIEATRESPVVRALEAGVRAAGGRPTLWRKGGTSDWNLVGPAWGVPGAAYGPGDPHLDHTASESVSERDLRWLGHRTAHRSHPAREDARFSAGPSPPPTRSSGRMRNVRRTADKSRARPGGRPVTPLRFGRLSWMNSPRSSSRIAVCSSARVFMTIGPYQATGSWSGRPVTRRKRNPCSPAWARTRSPSPKSAVSPAGTKAPSRPGERSLAVDGVDERRISRWGRVVERLARRDPHIQVRGVDGDPLDRPLDRPVLPRDHRDPGARVEGHGGKLRGRKSTIGGGGHLVTGGSIDPELETGEHPLGALRHLLVDDPAAGVHPLHISRPDDPLIAEGVAVGDLSVQDVRDGLDPPVRVPREPCDVVRRIA